MLAFLCGVLSNHKLLFLEPAFKYRDPADEWNGMWHCFCGKACGFPRGMFLTRVGWNMWGLK